MSRSKPCSEDPELWYSEDRADEAKAKALCHGCPWSVKCLDDTIEYESLSGTSRRGIFGGLTATERIRLQALMA